MKAQERPGLSMALAGFGVADIIGGIIMFIQSWPGAPDSGYRGLFEAYVPSLTWLSVSIVSGVLFFAAAAIIDYLAQIRTQAENMNWLLTHSDSAMWQACHRLQESIGQDGHSKGSNEDNLGDAPAARSSRPPDFDDIPKLRRDPDR